MSLYLSDGVNEIQSVTKHKRPSSGTKEELLPLLKNEGISYAECPPTNVLRITSVTSPFPIPFQYIIYDETERYQNVFKTYYARLCDAILVEEVLPHLVSSDVITVREMEDILVEKTTFRQARALLNGPIWRAISGGYPKAFVTLLCVLRSVRSCESLCEGICSELSISAEVISNESRELLWFDIP